MALFGTAGDQNLNITIRAKDEAADWALERLPNEHRAVLARARAVYLGEAEDTWDDLERVRTHVEHVVSEVDQARRSDSA